MIIVGLSKIEEIWIQLKGMLKWILHVTKFNAYIKSKNITNLFKK